MMIALKFIGMKCLYNKSYRRNNKMLSFRTQNRKSKIKNAILKSIMLLLFTITIICFCIIDTPNNTPIIIIASISMAILSGLVYLNRVAINQWMDK